VEDPRGLTDTRAVDDRQVDRLPDRLRELAGNELRGEPGAVISNSSRRPTRTSCPTPPTARGSRSTPTSARLRTARRASPR